MSTAEEGIPSSFPSHRAQCTLLSELQLLNVAAEKRTQGYVNDLVTIVKFAEFNISETPGTQQTSKVTKIVSAVHVKVAFLVTLTH